MPAPRSRSRFIVLALAWRTPRFDASDRRPPAARPGSPRLVDGCRRSRSALRVLGMAFFLYVGWAALAGPDLLVNPTFGVFYVLLWVGLVPASLLFGPFYKAVSPVRTLHLLFSKAHRRRPRRGASSSSRAWVGLGRPRSGCSPSCGWSWSTRSSTYLAPVRLWVAVYIAVVLVGGGGVRQRAGSSTADPFEAYSTLVGRLSVFGRRADGTLVLRSPLANLDGTPPWPGLVGVVAVLFGSTAFDSFKDSSTWLQSPRRRR